jgi:hypothetical protein
MPRLYPTDSSVLLSELRREFFQDFKNFAVVRSFAEFVKLSKDDPSRLVDDKNRTFVDSRNGIADPEHSVLLRNFSVRIKIAYQWVIQLPDLFFLPGNVAPGGIDANAQNLGIIGGELVEFSTVRRHLLASSRSPIERIKREHNVLYSPEAAQAHSVPAVPRDRRQVEVRGFTAYFEHNTSSALVSTPVLKFSIDSNGKLCRWASIL